MHSFSLIAISAALCIAWAGAAVPDGAWNGKPWKRRALETAVQRNDPEAMAEMAYWIREGRQAIHYDAKRVFELAKKSAEAGNPYGMTILSRCYNVGEGVEADQKAAKKWAKASMDAGHPLGKKNWANLQVGRLGGGNEALWRKLTREAADDGCELAFSNLCNAHWFGTRGFPRDRDKASQMVVDHFRAVKHCCIPTNQFLLTLSDQAEKLGITDEMLRRAEARLEEAAEAGLPGPAAVLGRHYCRMGDIERGFPLILRAAQAGDALAQSILFDYVEVDELSRPTGCATDRATLYRLARAVAAEKLGGHMVDFRAASSYVFPWVLHEKGDPAKAFPIAKKMMREKTDCWHIHFVMGRIFYSEMRGPLFDRKRGMAHYIYASDIEALVMERMAMALVDLAERPHDVALAYATMIRALKFREQFGNGDSKWAKNYRSRLLKAMSPEDKKYAEDMIARKYPTADEFRQKALETLIQYGDLPKGTKLKRHWYPAN